MGLAGTAIAVTLRWSMARVDEVGRLRAFPMVTVLAPATASAILAVPVIRQHAVQNLLSEASSRLVGHEVEVHCQSFGETWLSAGTDRGQVWFTAQGEPEPRTTIAYQTCRDLRGWVASDRDASDLDRVIAVHVVTHEAMHMAGIRHEAAAECAAVQRDEWTAALLGASPEDAEAMSRRYLLEVYPQLPDSYRSDQCASGGDLDEHLETSPWS